jgi:hypothetical protein
MEQTNTINAIKTKLKSSLVFTLEFTTSKLLSYIVVISSIIVGYLLTSPEIITTGLIIGAALSGVKNISESWIKLKNGGTSSNVSASGSDNSAQDGQTTKEIL